MSSLKQVLQRELEYPRVAGGLQTSEIVTGQSGEGGLLRIRYTGVTGGEEVRMVQNVHRFSAELYPLGLLECKNARQAGIHVEISGTAKRSGSHVSDSAWRRSGESVAIDPKARWIGPDQIVRTLVAVGIRRYLIRTLSGYVNARKHIINTGIHVECTSGLKFHNR